MSASDDATFWKGMTVVTAAYAVAFVVGLLAGSIVPTDHPLWVAIWADVAATATIFGFSLAFRNSSIYDPYWSVAPIAMVAYWSIFAGLDGQPVRQALVLGGVALWGTRLTTNWASGWSGLDHEDWRYVKLQRDTGRFYWLVSLLGIHYFPTAIVALALWPAYEAVASPAPLGVLDLVATAVVVLATVLEASADGQLHAFKARVRDRTKFIDEGLWGWSRHPNYLGEILFWWGLWLFAVAADDRHAITFPGALAMVVMFRFISIPMMEKRMVARRPLYAEQQKRVSMLIPLPPRGPKVDQGTAERDTAPLETGGHDAIMNREARLAIDTLPFVPPVTPDPGADAQEE